MYAEGRSKTTKNPKENTFDNSGNEEFKDRNCPSVQVEMDCNVLWFRETYLFVYGKGALKTQPALLE